MVFNNKGLKVLHASPSLNDHAAVVFSVLDGVCVAHLDLVIQL